MKYLKYFFIFFILLSCSSKKNSTNYQKAMKELKLGNFTYSAELFEELDDIEPFTKDSINGLIMASYSYYKAKDYENSLRIIDYFVQSNPLNENLDYLYYLKGLNYYDRIKSMNKSIDIIEYAKSAFVDFKTKYTGTIWDDDVNKKITRINTLLSGNEMTLGKFYFRKKNYIGAMNHYNNVLKLYSDSEYIPECLARLVEISIILNIDLDALKYYQMLITNYKDNKWTNYSTKIMNKYEKI